MSPMVMERVGGPLVGTHNALLDGMDRAGYGLSSTKLAPIIALEEYVLLPQATFVQVRSLLTGRLLVTLGLPAKQRGTIETVCVTSLARQEYDDDNEDDDSDEEASRTQDSSRECVILAGLRNGTIQEWTLDVASIEEHRRLKQAILPRRSFAIPKQHMRVVLHLSAPTNMISDGGTFVYALVQAMASPGASGNIDTVEISLPLHRIWIPTYQPESQSNIALKFPTETEKGSIWTVDTLEAQVGYEFDGTYINTVPFALASTFYSSSSATTQSLSQEDSTETGAVFLVVGSYNGISVYWERPSPHQDSNEQMVRLRTTNEGNPITCLDLCSTTGDLACGHKLGDVSIQVGLLSVILSYGQAWADYKGKYGAKKEDRDPNAPPLPVHPKEAVVTKHVHWHAHPVNALSYPSSSSSVEPNLYSGGEESVLVTWQLARGLSRPAKVMPRIAKGAIVHLVSTEEYTLVYCEDNTLSLFRTYNSSLVWRMAGLADSIFCHEQPSVVTSSKYGGNTLLALDPSTGLPILTGLSGAPGAAHWYDAEAQMVVAHLEVAPYNRTSRMEPTDTPMPHPEVTHLVMSQTTGRDMITIDTTLSENVFVGKRVFVQGEEMGLVSTIKFWTKQRRSGHVLSNRTNKGASKMEEMPYDLVAAMPNPHGLTNEVSAVAISPQGTVACSISHDEGAFRIWSKRSTSSRSSREQSTPPVALPGWTCRYKITTPAAFAVPNKNGSDRSRGGGGAISFSSDGSILAIAYGRTVALWDPDTASLLTTLGRNDGSGLDTVYFSKANHDMMLLSNDTGVSFRSPFASQVNKHERQDGWSYSLDVSGSGDRGAFFISCVAPIASHGLVAIAVYDKAHFTTRVLLLEEATGDPKKAKKDGAVLMWTVRSFVRAMTAGAKGTNNVIELFALTSERELLSLKMKDDASQNISTMGGGSATEILLKNSSLSATNAPKLSNLKRNNRKRTETDTEQSLASSKRRAVANFASLIGGAAESDEETMDATKSAPIATADLPVLSGTFTRAFLGQNLPKVAQALTSMTSESDTGDDGDDDDDEASYLLD